MRTLLIIVGCVLGVLIAALLLAAFNLNGLLERNRDVLERQAEAALGRPVRFGKLSVSLPGGLAVRVVDLHIGEDPAYSDRDFLAADDVYVGIRILPALRGRIEMSRIELRAPAITLIQTAEGLSTDSLGAGGNPPAVQNARPAPESPESPGPSSPVEFEVSSLVVTGGTLRLIDRRVSPASEIRVKALSLSADHLSRSRPIAFELSAAVFGSEAPNLQVSGKLGPLDAEALSIAFEASLAAFGGALEASGTRDTKDPVRPTLGVRTVATGMSVEQILESQSPGRAGFLSGTLDAETRVRGVGAAWEEIQPGLAGEGGFSIREGVIRDFNPAGPTLRAVMSIPAITERKVMEVLSKYPHVFGVGDTPFSQMDGRVEIRNTSIFVQDFVLRTAEYDLVGAGRYRFDGSLEFRTSLVFSDTLSAELIESTSTMRYLRNRQERVAIPVDVRGTTTKLSVLPDVTALANAASREALGRTVDRALGIEERQTKPGDPPKDPSTKDLGRDILRRGIDDLLRP